MQIVRALVAALALSAVAAPSSHAQSSSPLTAGLDSPTLADWPVRQWCRWNPDAVTLYTSLQRSSWPAPTQGMRALRFHVRNADVSPCTPTSDPRAQIATDKVLAAGREYWETFDIFFPASFPDVRKSRWYVFQQDFGEPWSGSPPLGFGVYDQNGTDKLMLRRDARFRYDIVWARPLVRGRWYRFRVHKRMAKDFGGWVELWVDGVRQTFADRSLRRATPTMHPNASGSYRFFLASYRQRGAMAGAVDTFVDNASVTR